ncbi:hypothetical protein L13192_12628 [Pyrenophora tritici-repentis]|nr:hypothetical protein L13192_12628 [Pyrenophora tritici-repentis]
MPPAPQPSPASGSKKNKIASTYGPNEKATTSNSAARREDQQNPLEPTSQPPSELSKNWTQADHNLLFIFHYLLHNTWKAVGEQLGPIDIQTNVSRNLGTRELFEEVDALNKAYGFRQLSYDSEKIIRDEEMVWDNMMVYVKMLQASETARNQRALIDSALYSPTVRSSDLASYEELHRPRQYNLPCKFPHSLSPL